MEREEKMENAGGRESHREGLTAQEGESTKYAARPALSWRAWVISVIVAVVLSVTATLLLGGSFRFTGAAISGGCGPGSACCPPPLEEGK